jgi:hypothetical protein
VCLDPFLKPADPTKQDHYYGASAGVEMSLTEIQFEMVYSNAKEVLRAARTREETATTITDVCRIEPR